MSFLSLIDVEFQKIRRSKIFLLLLIPIIILWIPSILNAHLNFEMQAEGILPEHNFLIQSFLGMAWFMYPSCLVVCTVLLSQTERSNKGILKMLSLPISTTKLCMAKFVVLIILAAVQMLMNVAMYFGSAAIASQVQGYSFILEPLFVLKETGLIFLSSIPMIAFYWMLSICIQTPIFSVGIGLVTIVPSLLLINTKIWFAYPMCYPFYIITSEYGKLATSLTTSEITLIPWLPIATIITIICMTVSCICFGQSERG